MNETIATLLEVREAIRADAEAKMDAITRTVEVLQGQVGSGRKAAGGAPGASAERPAGQDAATPSVREMLVQAGEALAEGQEERVFLFVDLKAWCLTHWPGEAKKIRTGIYGATNQIVTAGIWDKTERGFQIAQKRPEE